MADTDRWRENSFKKRKGLDQMAGKKSFTSVSGKTLTQVLQKSWMGF